MATIQSDEAAQRERHQEWYDPDITETTGPIRTLLETYSHIPPHKVVEHINDIRRNGFAASPYPCIGQYRFLSLTLITHPLYEDIVKRIKSSTDTRYLDLGCCFGQDLRQLVADGCPSAQLMGLDIEGPLMELGYDLFLDRDSLQSNFVVADVFKGSAQGTVWTQLEQNPCDIMHCSAFFHLFPLPDQVAAAVNLVPLVKVGGVIVGRQSGSIKPGDQPAVKAGTVSYRHDMQTLTKMWHEVGAKTGTRWRVEGTMDRVGMNLVSKASVEDESSRRILFSVWREV